MRAQQSPACSCDRQPAQAKRSTPDDSREGPRVNPLWHSLATRTPSAGASGSCGGSCEQGADAKQLSADVRADMESAFGVDFSPVRIFEGHAPRAIGALAYTQGTDIHFAPGQYQPTAPGGRELLGHELTHVVQQAQGQVSVSSPTRGVPLNTDPALEREADAVGAKAARGESVQLGQPGGPTRSVNTATIRTAGPIQAQDDDRGTRQVFIFGGVPDFLDCEASQLDDDANTTCCSSTTRGLIPGLYQTSREYTDRTITRMQNGDNMDGALRRHFGGGAIARRSSILASLRLIRTTLDGESSHIVRCRIALNAQNSIGYDLLRSVDRRLFCESNVNASAQVGGNVATLCVDADGRPAGGWNTLLHEMVHLVGVGNLPDRADATPSQIQSGEFESYEGGAGYPNPLPHSLHNADSYASFVRDVGASGWTAESNALAWLPNLEAGGAMSLGQNPRFGVEAGLTWTPLGRELQWIVGGRALWLAGEVGDPGVAATDLRAYAGAELGLRWMVGGDSAQFVLDVAGGAGAYVTVDDRVDPALAARIGLGARFGGPDLGFGVSADVMRLFHLDQGDLVGSATDDWFGGLVIRGHWGGTSATPR